MQVKIFRLPENRFQVSLVAIDRVTYQLPRNDWKAQMTLLIVISLRIMGSQVMGRTGDPKETWLIQSHSPLFFGGSQLVLRVFRCFDCFDSLLGSRKVIIWCWDLTLGYFGEFCSWNPESYRIQSSSENGFIEPKSYAEEVIAHPNHHLRVWLDAYFLCIFIFEDFLFLFEVRSSTCITWKDSVVGICPSKNETYHYVPIH